MGSRVSDIACRAYDRNSSESQSKVDDVFGEGGVATIKSCAVYLYIIVRVTATVSVSHECNKSHTTVTAKVISCYNSLYFFPVRFCIVVASSFA